MQGGEKKEHLSDELRAANSNFKIGKETHLSSQCFYAEKSELVELVNEYKSRKYDEDICVAENLGGKSSSAHLFCFLGANLFCYRF